MLPRKETTSNQNKNDSQPKSSTSHQNTGSTDTSKGASMQKYLGDYQDEVKSGEATHIRLDPSDSEGDHDEEEEEEEEEAEKKTKGKQPMQPSLKKTQTIKRTKWSAEEDRQLCVSWANTPIDEATGAGYWDRIHGHYVKSFKEKMETMEEGPEKDKKLAEFNERTPNSVKIHWGIIQAKTIKFLKYFQEAGDLASEHPYDKVMEIATNDYNNHEDDDFDVGHCFPLLRELPKFLLIVKDHKNKPAKEAARKAKEASTLAEFQVTLAPSNTNKKETKRRSQHEEEEEDDDDSLASFVVKKVKRNQNHNLFNLQEMIASNKIAQRKSDFEIMSIDLSQNFDKVQLEFYKMQREIVMLRTRMELDEMRKLRAQQLRDQEDMQDASSS